MYDERTRAAALALLATGSLSAASRATGVSRSTLRAWRDAGEQPVSTGCPRCADRAPPGLAYAALLGYYLGDGYLSRCPRYFALRVSCDAAYPAVVDDVADLMGSIRPERPVFRVRAPGVVVVQSHWTHWPCLFPQHGPGRKHERPIVLEDWQRTVVEEHPGAFLRGLFHSDGSRVRNWATRVVAGSSKRYEYPRWQFSNRSPQILDLCCWALDLIEIPWRRSARWMVSVSTRDGVARLDALIGLKS